MDELRNWLGLQALSEITRWKKLGGLLGFLLVLCGLMLAVFCVAALFFVAGALVNLGPYAGEDSHEAARNIGLLLAAVIGIPFLIWRSVVAQKQVDVSEQGHITDRINKAVEGLGAQITVKEIQKTPRYHVDGDGNWRRDDDGNPVAALRPDGAPIIDREEVEHTAPNLEVRIGAIYALERIAKDSDRDHVEVMEILCAYIRQNAPTAKARPWPQLEMKDGEKDGPLDSGWLERQRAFGEAQETAKKDLAVREDIQAALTVIGRRSGHQRGLEAQANGGTTGFVFDIPCPAPNLPEDSHDPVTLRAFSTAAIDWQRKLRGYRGFRLDLRRTNLVGADLSSLNLNGARFSASSMQGANLVKARLQGADLREAQLQRADLREAQLQGANLEKAQLQGANLMLAPLQRSNLVNARLQGANLLAAQLQKANLMQAWFQGAQLWKARLQGADLAAARLQGADLREVRLQGAYLGGARLDASNNFKTATLQGAGLSRVDCTNLRTLAEHADHMFGDGTVTLPGDHWPDHWPREELSGNNFQEAWRAWQATLPDLQGSGHGT